MTPDESYAALLVSALLVLVTQRNVEMSVLNLLVKLTRPIATSAIGVLVFLAYVKKFHLSFLVLSVIGVFLLKDLWTMQKYEPSKLSVFELGLDHDRFDSSTSIDLQMAEGTVKHAPPNLLTTEWSPTLMIFPPTKEEMDDMGRI